MTDVDRSLERIESADLERLCQLAQDDLRGLFQRRPETGRLYSDRLPCIALCQGAALHYLNGRNGIKDWGSTTTSDLGGFGGNCSTLANSTVIDFNWSWQPMTSPDLWRSGGSYGFA
jgi:hypothetical protein